jgi:hypothetical protein
VKRLILSLAMLALPVAAQAQDQQIDASAIYSSGDLTLSPTGGDVLPDGSSINLGSDADKFLTLHAAELWVQTLIARDTMATIGGRVLVAPTTTLVADLTTSATTIHVKHNDLASGDRIVLESGGSLEWMAVTSSASGSAGDYTYSVTRDLDGSGANTWSSGDAVLNTGASGDGFIDLYSDAGVIPGDTVGPSIVGNVRTGTDWDAVSPRWALGNLDGLYGYSSTTYGAAFGDPSGAWLKIDATNGVLIGYDSTTKISLDASGNADISGALEAGSITTDKLAVGAGGAALNPDPNMLDATAWSTTGTGASFTTVTDGKVGTHVFRSGTAQANLLAIASQRVPVDLTKTYRIHGWFRRNSTGNGNVLIGVSLYDASGNVLDNTGSTPGNGSLWWYACNTSAASMTTDTWASCDMQFGAGATKTLPSNARAMSPLALLNVSGSAGYEEVQDIRIEEALPSTLIQDGVITTNKLAANAVTAAKIAANTITASQIASDTITASQIAANAITTSELAADSVTSAKIVAGTIVASDIATGTITADRMNVSTLSAITANLGTVTAGTINGVTIIGGSITAGGGSEVFMDNDGIQIESGTGVANKIKFSDGSQIYDSSGTLELVGDGGIHMAGGGGAVAITGESSVGVSSLAGTGTRHVCATNIGTLTICP